MPDAGSERFTQLYRDHYDRVLAYALRRAPAEVASEAVDETFLIAWRTFPDLPDDPLPWLLVVARNAINQQYRRGKRRADVILLELDRIGTPHAAADLSESVAERAAVLQALASLSDLDREALMLSLWDGLAASDAARVAGCSTTAFAVRLHRARRRLRAALARFDEIDNTGPLPAVQEVR
ncbi:RNA polymerase sigma factor [Pseudonocardia sp. TRM90224]|uniref:RNA polymerase sigma factor n=1 Tax=Pseudonocardia sp. TRM90224 TaxID=2812678 RepID=UPI001E4D4EB8|nr:sigma-70 family RNA polymerase sigma factor [Pseudonocardia sp. TRM90224]